MCVLAYPFLADELLATLNLCDISFCCADRCTEDGGLYDWFDSNVTVRWGNMRSSVYFRTRASEQRQVCA